MSNEQIATEGERNAMTSHFTFENRCYKISSLFIESIGIWKCLKSGAFAFHVVSVGFFPPTLPVVFQAKKRQVNLEDTYGGSMRELELLLDNFDVDGEKKKRGKGEKAAAAGDKPVPVSPSLVLESLRRTLMQYKKNLNVTCEEVS